MLIITNGIFRTSEQSHHKKKDRSGKREEEKYNREHGTIFTAEMMKNQEAERQNINIIGKKIGILYRPRNRHTRGTKQ